MSLTSDVGDCVPRGEVAEALGQAGPTLSAQCHGGSGEESTRPGEARVVGVVIGDGVLRGRLAQTFTGRRHDYAAGQEEFAALKAVPVGPGYEPSG